MMAFSVNRPYEIPSSNIIANELIKVNNDPEMLRNKPSICPEKQKNNSSKIISMINNVPSSLASLKNLKLWVVIVFVNIIFGQGVWGQANGDYRSKATGDWTTSGTWEFYNGSSWVALGTTLSTDNNAFTTDPSWTNVQIGSGINWIWGSASGNGNGGMSYTNPTGTISNGTWYYKSITLSAGVTYSLTFDYKTSNVTSSNSRIVVDVSANIPTSSTSWTGATELYNALQATSGQWANNTGTATFTAINSGTYYLGFRNAYADAPAAITSSVDNITLTGTCIIPSSTSGAIAIQSPNVVTVSSDLTVDQLTINSGSTLLLSAGTLTVNNGADANDFIIKGTYKRTASLTTIAGTGAVYCDNGGIYEHALNGGIIPTITWNTGSALNFTGVTSTMPTATGTYQNVIWNCTTQSGALGLENNLNTINGSLTIQSTNSQLLYLGNLDATPRTMTIGGNLNMEAGIFAVRASAFNTSLHTINVAGNYNQTGGNFQLSRTTAGTNIPILNVAGDFTCSGGTLDNNAGANTLSTINFTKSGTQLFTLGGTIANGIELNVKSGSVLEFASATTVLSNTSVNCKFTVESGGGMIIKHAQGVSTTASTGCINIGAPTAANYILNVAGNYTFNGSVGQVTGNKFPATVNSISLSNSSGLSLTGGLIVNGTLTLTSGKLSIGANTLTLAGTVASMSAANSLTGSASSNLTINGTGSLGTLYFDQTSTGTSNKIAAFTINRTSTGTATLGNDLVIAGAATFTAGKLSIGANTLTLNGTVASMTAANSLTGSASSNLSIGGTGTMGDLCFDQTSTATKTIQNLTINRPTSGSLTIANPLIVSANLYLYNATVTASTDNLTLSNGATITRTAATLSAVPTFTTSANVTYGDGSYSTAITTGVELPTAASGILNNLTLNVSGGVNLNAATTISGILTLTAGKLTIGANTLTLNGTVASMSATNSLTGSASSNLSIGGTGDLGTLYFDQTTPGTTNNFATFTINRTSTGIATLGNNATVSSTLNLTNGLLTTSSNTLTLTSAGTITNASSSSYVNGKLARAYSGTGSKDFAIGKGGNYRPITLNYSALTGTSTVTAEQIESSIPGTGPASTDLFTSRYWTLTQSGGSAFSYALKLDGTGFSPTRTVKMIKGDGSSNTAYDVTTPNYTNSTPFTSFSNFGLGELSSISTSTTPADNAACYGTTSVNLTATVSPNPGGGTVQFYIDASSVGSPASLSSGTATVNYDPSALSVGGHTIRADFSAFGDYLASSSNPGNDKTLTIQDLPSVPTAVTPSSGVAICNGESTNVNATSAGNTINWYSVSTGGTLIGNSASAADYSVSPTSSTTYYAETKNSNLCLSATRTATALVSVKQLQAIRVNVNYCNLANTVLNSGITAELWQSGVSKATTSTVAGGQTYYEFSNLCPGVYDVSLTSTASSVGAVNGTDAAQVNYWGGHTYGIEKVRYYAGDVTGTGSPLIAAADAQQINSHFVNGTALDHAAWVFWKTGDASITEQISTPPATYPNPYKQNVTLSEGSNASINFYGLCSGDFNMSYNNSKNAGSNVGLVYENNLLLNNTIHYKVPVLFIYENTIGALSLVMNFPSESLAIEDVVMNTTEGQLDWAVKGNELRIGWFSKSPQYFAAGAELFSIHFKTLANGIADESKQFSLTNNALNELADAQFKVIPNAQLSMKKIKLEPLAIQEASSAVEISFSSRPNPFNASSTINYSLPFEGNVKIEIYDFMGNLIKQLINEPQTKGNHSLMLEATMLNTGMYMAKLSLTKNDNNIIRTIKLIKRN